MFRYTNIQSIGFIWFLLLLNSCDTGKRVDREGLEEEMRSREIKRISKGELMAKGEEVGSSLVEKAQETFQQALMKAIRENGLSGAIPYCNINAYDLVKNLEDSLGVEIKRATNQPRNPLDSLSAFEKEVFEAYKYAPEHATAQIQELDDKSLIYNKPIRISNAACLSCHGKVGTDITQADYEKIKSLYPDDAAVGYEMGELRGMWSIKIPKRTIVDLL